MTIFVDSSFYLSLLMPQDSNHLLAVQQAEELVWRHCNFATSQAVIGEVLTVGSQRFDKSLTLAFVGQLMTDSTLIVLENSTTTSRAWKLFQQTRNKNISWVDCYSVAIVEYYQFNQLLSFDKDLLQLSQKVQLFSA